tara:strand:+ start:11889 stop:11993 length:105 start_codon:yes stop_codon:yes gene_type:complete
MTEMKSNVLIKHFYIDDYAMLVAKFTTTKLSALM